MKILVVRFSSIGDVVLTTPVIRCLEQQLPDAEIHVLTKKAFASLFENNPHCHRLFTIEKDIHEVIHDLKKMGYDHIIDLHNNLRSRRLSFQLGVPTVRFPKKNWAKWLLTFFKYNKMPDIHVVDRYFKTVQFLGVSNDLLPCDFFLTEQEKNEAEQLVPNQPFVAVAMGAQFATKQIPTELLVKCLNEVHLPVVLLGGPTDIHRAEQVKNALNHKILIDFCGKLSLRSSVAVLEKAQVLLTGDTGLMHLASCFQLPIVSVWGNTVPQLGMYPYEPQVAQKAAQIEQNNLSCRPCSKIGYQKCPKGHFNCMAHNPQEIIQAIQKRCI